MNKNWGTDLSDFSHCCERKLLANAVQGRMGQLWLTVEGTVHKTGKRWWHECEVVGATLSTARNRELDVSPLRAFYFVPV